MKKSRQFETYGKHDSIIYSTKYDFSYISIPKAANTSVKIALLPTIRMSKHSTVQGEPVLRSIHKKDGSVFDYISKENLVAERPSFIFSVVRDPWSRILSCYVDKFLYKFHEPFRSYGLTPESSFEAFVDVVADTPDYLSEIHFRSQCSLLSTDGQLIPNLVLNVEHLREKWNVIEDYFKDNHNLEIDKIPHLNKKSNINHSISYNKSTFKKIENRFSNDISVFGLDFDRHK